MAGTTFLAHFLGPDTHANRPSATGLPDGVMYACTTHSKIERVVSEAWVDYYAFSVALGVAADTVWDTKGDLAVATAADTASKLAAGANTKVLTADSSQSTGLKWQLTKDIEVKVIDDATVVTTGDGKIIFCIPASLGGCDLTAAHAFVTTVSSSGLPTVQIRNVTQAADMLTTKITIDASEFTSYSAATAPVIDTGNDDVATGDLIAVDVDVAGTGAKGLGVVLSLDPPVSYSSEVLADSPLLYVRFEETAGATCANDGSLAGNATAAGTYTRNISTGMAGVGVGIDVDGSTGQVTYPDTASLDITGDVTYECWVNADVVGTAYLMSKGQTSAVSGYRISLRSLGSIRILVNGTNVLTSATGAVVVGTWVHIAFTRSGNNFVVYVDGSSFATGSNAAAANATSEPFGIGFEMTTGTPSTFYNGKIDEVAVYNTALSGARIAAHYAARNTGGVAAAAFVPQIVIT